MAWQDKIDRVFRRRENVRKEFGGNQVMGISEGNDNTIIVVSDPYGNRYGYHDRYLPDGSYEYYGQRARDGDPWNNNNAQIRDHIEHGDSILLFVKEDGEYRFTGEWFFNGFRTIEVGAVDSRVLQVIFNLVTARALSQEALELETAKFIEEDFNRLRERAIAASNNREKDKMETTVYYRSAVITAYVLRRAKGECECCGTPAPFNNRKGKPYLECHHVDRRADSGPDDIYSVIALHPLCHSRIHHSIDGKIENEKARTALAKREPKPSVE